MSSTSPLDQRSSVAASNGLDHFGPSARRGQSSVRAAVNAAASRSGSEVTLFCASDSFSTLELYDLLCSAIDVRHVS